MLNLWSHLIASSSAVWSAWILPGNFINGHSLTICDIVCLSPHAQNGSSRMPQSYRVAAQRPWPVRYRLRIVQSLLLRSKPGWRMVGSVIRKWLGTSGLNQSSFQATSTEQSDHIGCLDGSRNIRNMYFICTDTDSAVSYILYYWPLIRSRHMVQYKCVLTDLLIG